VPIEAQEALYPLRVEKLAFTTDSGGAGEFRGGLGMEKVVTAVSPCTAALNIDRTQCPGWGILGGLDGRPSVAYHEHADHPPKKILKDFVELKAGEKIRVFSGGGGGYGDPHKRDPSAVARDVRLGYVSREVARNVYGVVLDETGEVLMTKTNMLRRARGQSLSSRWICRSWEE
jgi:N-methylhydantoinase B